MRLFSVLPSILSSFMGPQPVSNRSEVARLSGVFSRLSAGSHPKHVEPIRRFTEEEISMLVQNP